MAVISFKPKQLVKRLLSVVSERSRTVLIERYGLEQGMEKRTLEKIGERYDITRERVRQIENTAIRNIQKSEIYQNEEAVFEELRQLMRSMGGVVNEQEFLDYISRDATTQNHIHFLLVIGAPFLFKKEDTHFHRRWSVDEETSEKVHDSLRKLYKSLSDDELVPESEMITRFLEHLKDVSEQYKNEEIIKRWLSLSRAIGRNPLGEWGVAHSPNVRARGMRDYAYLVLRRNGNPMHFTEVANNISEVFGKRAHVATCHNELIKDDRFVLVGRGLYALSEWGHEKGVVKNVIHRILQEKGPLAKEEVIDEVLKRRYVKENTILVNLQDSNMFSRTADGKYTAAA